jgi:hypothetical protein
MATHFHLAVRFALAAALICMVPESALGAGRTKEIL